MRSRRTCTHETPLLAVDDASQLPRRRGTFGVCACVCVRALGRVRVRACMFALGAQIGGTLRFVCTK
jgi:hypothetical protein